jgi:hypothetical protein
MCCSGAGRTAVAHREIPDRAATRLLDAILGQMLFAIIQTDGAPAIPYTPRHHKSL